MSNQQARTAVITGAAQGIGRAFAERLAADGLTVVAVDMTTCDDTVAAIRSASGNAHAIACDVTDEAAVAALRDEVIERFGGADVLVNNAMGYAMGPIETMSLGGST